MPRRNGANRPALLTRGGPIAFRRKKRGCSAVSMYPCSVCHRRVPGKIATSYNRWFSADGKNIGWKQRLCPACAVSHLKPLFAHANSDSMDVSECPACGTDSSTDMEPVYITFFTPGSEGKEFQLPTCAGCAPTVKALLSEGGEPLADRGASRGVMTPREPQDPFGDMWS